MLWTKIKVLISKFMHVALTDPRALGPKISRKIYAMVAARCDLEVFYPDHVLIDGRHYPVADLLPASPQPERSGDGRPVVIIVPVYRDITITKRCLDSVIAEGLPKSCRLLVIEDKSPDSGMAAALDAYRRHPNVTVLHNNENLGFVKTVNFGMKWSGQDDVILLNSDTEVAGDWVERITRHVITSGKVASVTATSNHATICSFPIMEERAHWPLGLSTATIQKQLGRHNNLRSIEIPTGVGFCMYITRSALTDVGLFDEEAFGKGYGEECDFCMRALKRGWKHLQALDVGVFHQGEVSFAKTSNPSKERSEKIVRERYPKYASMVSKFAGRDPARAVRMGALLDCLGNQVKPTELIVTHIHGGGVERVVQETVANASQDRHFLILRQDKRTNRYIISSADPSLGINLGFSVKHAPRVLQEVCGLAQVKRIQLHHVMDLDSHLMRELKDLNVPFDFYMHDYWTICPQINLTDLNGKYCGEPAADVCNRCIASRSLRPLPALPQGLPDQIEPWREFYTWIFDRASAVVCPSRDVEARVKRYHPQAKTVVRYHEDQVPLKRVPLQKRIVENDKPLRVAVLGAMAMHKGSAIIKMLVDYAKSKPAHIEIVIVGTFDHRAESLPGIHVLGSYREEDLQSILTKNNIHLIWFPPGAPETYSYTLSHAMRFGYAVLAPRFGAFTERLAGREHTWTYDIQADIADIYQLMIQARLELM